ncbi:SKP1-like protein 1A [Platanthera guangdongensis]|uniref:SKP1-like protein n=1 Tax=Platanthera guangdongensis TaxID=2320717 RepID=A0ABR2MTB4_9ASPA
MAEERSEENMAKPAMLKLKSSDEVEFTVEAAALMQSQMLRNMIEEGCVDSGVAIPIPKVSASVLTNVLSYCTNHANPPRPLPSTSKSPDDLLKELDRDLVNSINTDITAMLELVLAANYLDIKGLMDLSCQAVADAIQDMSPEEVREIFNIENDFTPEEERQVRRDNAWAFK